MKKSAPTSRAGKVSTARRTSARAPAPPVNTQHAEAALPADTDTSKLAVDLGRMIEDARRQVAVAANAALTTLYWHIGERVRTEVLEGRRAEYGAQIVATVGRQLEERYGRGFGEKNLRRMVQFATAFPDREIVAALLRQLGWSHFRQPIDEDCDYVDLLFSHHRLRRLVAIELKLGTFKPADSGQMELYLRWLDSHERQPHEDAPLGIITGVEHLLEAVGLRAALPALRQPFAPR